MKRPEYKTTLEDLVAVKLPEQTKRYKPVSHGQLIDLTLNGIEKAGFKLDKQSYNWAGDGQVANGKYTISNIADREMQIQIAWQNSYNKQVSLKFAIGIQVFICANGMVNGDMGTFKRKHTGDVQEFTPQSITEYIKSAGDSFREMQIQRELMKQIELTKRQQGELIGRMIVEEGFISSSELNIIRKELQHPTHNYGAENSLWELYQHTTFSLKETHPTNWMTDHMSAHSFFVNAQGELISQRKPAVITAHQLAYQQLELSL
jgi:hypothetical protein